MSNFSDFIRSHGYEPKSDVIAGKFVRFGRKNSVSAKLFDDGFAGYLQDWRTGEKFYWFSDTDQMSPKRRQDIEDFRMDQDAKRSLGYANVAKQAEKLFSDASNALASHPYLVRKQVKPYGIKQIENSLLIPVYSVSGGMQSIQFIDDAGNKKFLKGGKVSGGSHFIGEIKEAKPVYICEGYATAVSIYEDVQSLAIVAFNAGNLINVATDLKKQLPEVEIVIAGDSDPVGRKYAELTAKAVNGEAIFPDFGSNPHGYTDFNDYFNFQVSL